jgi:hypothetical protein
VRRGAKIPGPATRLVSALVKAALGMLILINIILPARDNLHFSAIKGRLPRATETYAPR